MSNDFIGSAADLLISFGETKRHAKKRIFDDCYQLLIEIEKALYNLIASLTSFSNVLDSSNDWINSPSFKKIASNYAEFKGLIGENRSHISEVLYKLSNDIETIILRQLRKPKALFFAKNTDLDDLQERFIKQLKIDRKQLAKGKV